MNGMRAALVGVLAGLLMISPALRVFSEAQGAAATTFKPEELEQIAAPVALYPDPLLAQVMMASTYPLEVVQAARFVRDNPSLKGEPMNAALKKQPWDDSVKSLVAVPQVLGMMSDKLDWTQKLGDSFLAQQKELMDAVQRLRAKAQAQGALTTTKEQKVVVETVTPTTTIIKIESTSPQVVYVPVYNPTVVYGVWAYPAYPPYYYYPPGYVAGTALFSFTAGVIVGSAIWGGCNWHRGEVNVDVDHYNSFTKNVNTTNIAAKRTEVQNTRASGGNGTWQHDPEHRKGVQYRDQATQQRFNKTDPPNAQTREACRGRGEQGRAEPTRQTQPANRSGQASGTAFEGLGNGAQAQSFSDRGRASRESPGTSRAAGGFSGGGRRR